MCLAFALPCCLSVPCCAIFLPCSGLPCPAVVLPCLAEACPLPPFRSFLLSGFTDYASPPTPFHPHHQFHHHIHHINHMDHCIGPHPHVVGDMLNNEIQYGVHNSKQWKLGKTSLEKNIFFFFLWALNGQGSTHARKIWPFSPSDSSVMLAKCCFSHSNLARATLARPSTPTGN